MIIYVSKLSAPNGPSKQIINKNNDIIALEVFQLKIYSLFIGLLCLYRLKLRAHTKVLYKYI